MLEKLVTYPEPKISNIRFLFKAPIPEIRKIVDSLTDKAILRNINNAKVLIQKTEPVYLEVKDNQQLYIVTALKVHFDKAFGPANISGAAHLKLHIVSSLAINENWDLITLSKIDKIEWLESTKINLFSLGFSSNLLQSQLEQRLLHDIPVQIDEGLKKSFDLRMTVAEIWEKQQQFIPMPDVSDVHVRLAPSSLRFSQIIAFEDAISIFIEEQTKVYIRLGTLASYKPNIQPLPPFNELVNQPDSFDSTVALSLSIEHLNQMMELEANGKQVETRAGQYKLRDVKLQGVRNHLVFSCLLEGAVNVSCAVDLQLKVVDKVLQIDILNISFQNNFLLKAMGKLFRTKLIEVLNKEVNKVILSQFDELFSKINNSIRQIPLDRYIDLNGTVSKLEVVDVVNTAEDIFLNIFVAGNLVSNLKSQNGSL